MRYYYPGRLLGWELTTIFLFLFIDGIRLLLGELIDAFAILLTICNNFSPFYLSIKREQDIHDTPARLVVDSCLANDSVARILYFLADIYVRTKPIALYQPVIKHSLSNTQITSGYCNQCDCLLPAWNGSHSLRHRLSQCVLGLKEILRLKPA